MSVAFAYREDFLPHYTYDDYLMWDGDWEVIGGIAYAMAPSPNITHQELNLKIGLEFMQKLKSYQKYKVIPEIDWKVAKDTVVRPDTLVICDVKKKGAYISQTPEVVVEIVSVSSQKRDRGVKKELYQSQGVLYYIIVEPVNKNAQIFKLEEGSYKDEGTFSKQSYNFDIKNCQIEIDFKEIFEGI